MAQSTSVLRRRSAVKICATGVALGLAGCGEPQQPEAQQAESPAAPAAEAPEAAAPTAEVDQAFIDHMHAHAGQPGDQPETVHGTVTPLSEIYHLLGSAANRFDLRRAVPGKHLGASIRENQQHLVGILSPARHFHSG